MEQCVVHLRYRGANTTDTSVMCDVSVKQRADARKGYIGRMVRSGSHWIVRVRKIQAVENSRGCAERLSDGARSSPIKIQRLITLERCKILCILYIHAPGRYRPARYSG